MTAPHLFRLALALLSLTFCVVFNWWSARILFNLRTWEKIARLGVSLVALGVAIVAVQLAQTNRPVTFGAYLIFVGFVLGIIGYASGATQASSRGKP